MTYIERYKQVYEQVNGKPAPDLVNKRGWVTISVDGVKSCTVREKELGEMTKRLLERFTPASSKQDSNSPQSKTAAPKP